jgi:hypothetical protein
MLEKTTMGSPDKSDYFNIGMSRYSIKIPSGFNSRVPSTETKLNLGGSLKMHKS